MDCLEYFRSGVVWFEDVACSNLELFPMESELAGAVEDYLSGTSLNCINEVVNTVGQFVPVACGDCDLGTLLQKNVIQRDLVINDGDVFLSHLECWLMVVFICRTTMTKRLFLELVLLLDGLDACKIMKGAKLFDND